MGTVWLLTAPNIDDFAILGAYDSWAAADAALKRERSTQSGGKLEIEEWPVQNLTSVLKPAGGTEDG